MPMRNIQKRWIFPDPVEVPDKLEKSVAGDPLVSSLLVRRGVTSPSQAAAFLDPACYNPTPGSSLPGLVQAVERLSTALNRGQRILIWGDFDVDGQTSTALLVSALRELGCLVDFYIPHRLRESHGLDPGKLLRLIHEKNPQVILTCDTGIDAHDAVEAANAQNIDVLITDHHQLPVQLPPAHSIINPNLTGSDHPLATLPGVGVAYKLIESLFNQLGVVPEKYLDLVALGIVADVATLSGDTRFLLQRGLPVLKTTNRPGLQALYQNAGLNPDQITEDVIGFQIAPRLNALGRLSDANSCVDFFTTNRPDQARKLANTLEQLNARRQQLTDEIYSSALEKIHQAPDLLLEHQALVLLDPGWHPGVIGIVASRLVDKFYKPVILLTTAGNSARGSARSIPGVPIASLIASQDELLTAHGGHPMAAGLSLPLEKVPEFRRNLSNEIHHELGDELPQPTLNIDAEIDFSKITIPFIEDISRLAPFGPGNPALLFATRKLTITDSQLIGKNKEHRKLLAVDSNNTVLPLLWWRSAERSLPKGSFDAAYTLQISTFHGKSSPQITIQDLRVSPETPSRISPPIKKTLEIIDYRADPAPLPAVSSAAHEYPDSVIWVEAHQTGAPTGLDRTQLSRASTLIIWTTPPSARLLQEAVQDVSPDRILLFAIDPPTASPSAFMDHLQSLSKYALTNRKSFQIETFAAKTAQTATAVRLGLACIENAGLFDYSPQGDLLTVQPGAQTRSADFPSDKRKLLDILQETMNYRYYLRSAKIHSLF